MGGSAPGEPPNDEGRTPGGDCVDLDVGSLCTVVSPDLRVASVASASAAEVVTTRRPIAAERTELARFCSDSALLPRVQPALEAGDPDVHGAGDRRYALGEELGAGGFGTVKLAVDRDLRRPVAIKTLNQRALDDPLQVQAFLEEAIITGSLEHPGIVPIYELSHSTMLGPYYAMKRLRGRPFSDVVRALGRGEPEATTRYHLYKLLTVFVEAARAVAFAHARGVVHSDLKPANILIGDLDEVVVVDWGLARVLGPGGRGQARALLRAGTPAYTPPEQASGAATDVEPATDVWSLGVMLYEILTLTLPFRSNTVDGVLAKVIGEPVEPPSRRAPTRDIPPALEEIALRALEKDRRKRYASVVAMLADLEAFIAGHRDRERREEIAEGALTEAEGSLRGAKEGEAEIDRLQARALEASALAEEAVAAQLDSARADLLTRYSQAATAVTRGLAAQPRHKALAERLGQLYWRIFLRIHPARVAPAERHRRVAQKLLADLAGLGLGAIVRAAPRPEGQPAAESTDPWLDAVQRFVRSDGVGASEAPGAIAPLVERIALLKGVPLFRELGGSDLLPIAELCSPRRYAASESVFREGDPGDALYVVTRGEVDILRDGQPLARMRATDCFGEIAVLDDAPRTAAAICATEVDCLVLTAGQFRSIVTEHGAIGWSVIRVLTERLRQATLREAAARTGAV